MKNPTKVRFFTLLSQYRRPTDFDDEKLKEAEKNYQGVVKSLAKAIKNASDKYEKDDEIEEIKNKFIEAMDDDFNTSLAISYIYEASKLANKTDDKNKLKGIVDFFNDMVEPILGLSFKEETAEDSKEAELIELIIALRKQARDEKRYDLSDEIRDKLSAIGITLKDSREGTTYEK